MPADVDVSAPLHKLGINSRQFPSPIDIDYFEYILNAWVYVNTVFQYLPYTSFNDRWTERKV